MSRRAPVGPLLLIAAALAAAPGAPAQQTEAERVRELDELWPRLQEAEAATKAALDRLEMERQAREPETVEFRVGPMRVVTYPGAEETALDVVGGVWEREFASWIDASPGFEMRRFFFDWDLAPGRRPRSSPELFRIQGAKWRSRDYMERGVRSSIVRVLRDDIGRTEVGRWAPGDLQEPRRPEDIYRALATVASTSVRACLSGDDQACLVSMGLGVDDDPVDDWYDQEERYLVARAQRTLLYSTGTGTDIQACDTRVRAGCDALIASFSRRNGPAWLTPIRPETRATLVWFALRTGGPGAWTRLTADPGADPRAALEAASGMPVEELVAAWRAYAVEHRPTAHADIAAGSLGALFWILLFSTLAQRSSRWRLG